MSWDPSRAMPDTCQTVPDRRDAQLGPRFWNLLFSTVDRVIMLLHRLEFTVISTNLTQRQVGAVCDTFHPAHPQEWTAATIDRNGQEVPGWIRRAGGEQASPAARITPPRGSAPHLGMEEQDDAFV
jgi:hypothetical protein